MISKMLYILLSAECNPCLSGPCFNGGSCNAVDEENYECQCPEGLSGIRKQTINCLISFCIYINFFF